MRFPGPSFAKTGHTRASTREGVPEARLHGGDIDAARWRWPGAPQPWIDLSTGINPHSYPVPELPSEAWSRLPLASELEDLCHVAANYYRLSDSDMVVAAPGSQALIQLVPRLYQSRTVAVLGPTYSEHAACWRAAGHEVTVVSCLEDAASADTVIVVNPNNPTGRIITSEALLALGGALAARNGLLIVDEAFADFTDENVSLASDIGDTTLILRSVGKAFGLAGLRLGFGLASASLVEKLRDAVGPWAVSGPALRVGARALADETWISATCDRLKGDVHRLSKLLLANGFSIVGQTRLFVLASHLNGNDLYERLGQSGIYVRQFHDEPQWIRFGIPGSEETWSRLETALQLG